MANQTDVLRALASKEGPVDAATLAKDLRTSDGTIRAYFSKMKKKGYVDGGGTEWYITEAGRAALLRGEKVVTTKEDVGEDELSKFAYYGQLSAVDPDKVTACTELFQNTNMRSMDEFDRVMAELNVPQNQRTQWRSLYIGYLRNTTPPEKREALYPLPSPEEVKQREEAAAAGERPRGEGVDYIVEDNNILKVGAEMGMFTFKEALQVVAAKRGTGAGGGGFGDVLTAFANAVKTLNPNEPLTVENVIDIFDKITESRGKGDGGGQTPPVSFVIEDGQVRELKAGQPIVIHKDVQQPGKTLVVTQTPEGIKTEEHVAGSPIIINAPQPSPSPGSNLPPMMPFPVIGSDGQPVYDKDGKPVYANIEPMMKWLGFQSEQKRADERHNMLMGVGQTVRENASDIIAAFKVAAEEIKTGTKVSAPTQEQPQVKCSCGILLNLPAGDWQEIQCPGPECQRVWTRDQVKEAMGA